MRPRLQLSQAEQWKGKFDMIKRFTEATERALYISGYAIVASSGKKVARNASVLAGKVVARIVTVEGAWSIVTVPRGEVLASGLEHDPASAAMEADQAYWLLRDTLALSTRGLIALQPTAAK